MITIRQLTEYSTVLLGAAAAIIFRDDRFSDIGGQQWDFFLTGNNIKIWGLSLTLFQRVCACHHHHHRSSSKVV